MIYSPYNFLKDLTPTDNTINILFESQVKYSLNPFSVIDMQVKNSLLEVKMKSGKIIPLNFSDIVNARIGFTRLKEQLDNLTNKTPAFVEKDVKLFIEDKIDDIETVVNNDIVQIENDITNIENRIDALVSADSTIDYLDMYLRLTDDIPDNDPTPNEIGLTAFGLTGM